LSGKAFFFGSFLLGLTKRNELGRVADETLLLYQRQRPKQRRWMTSHSAVENPACTGMTSNSKSQMDPSFRWDDDQKQRPWMDDQPFGC